MDRVIPKPFSKMSVIEPVSSGAVSSSTENFCRLFEHIPNAIFYLKDLECRFLFGNENLLNRYGLSSEHDLLGQLESSFVPGQLAADSMADDRLVMTSHRPVIDRIEPFPSQTRVFEWCITVKYPFLNEAGDVVGVIGVSRPLEGGGGFIRDARMNRAVRWLDEHLHEDAGVEAMASSLGVSSRQLQRVFKREVGLSVSEFVVRSRIFRATQLLQSGSESVGDIAIQVGFCDQSALSRNFRKFLGCTPLQWRRKL